MKAIRFPLLLAALLVGACSPFAPLNLFVPSSGYSIEKDLAYGENDRQKLDIYIPEQKKSDKVVVFMYGGKWMWGSKDDYKFAGQAFASQGFITVIPDYRILPEARFPEFLYDTAEAVKWVENNIGKYGGNPEELYLVGHSAGAYNAAMVTLDPEFLKKAGAKRSAIKGFAGMAGPYDFLPSQDPVVIDIFSPAKDMKKTQPINFAAGKNPPALLMTGDKDTTVSPENTDRLAKKLQDNGAKVKKIIYPGIDHADIILSISSAFRKKDPALADIVRFINEN